MKTIYIGKENGQETVVETSMGKPDIGNKSLSEWNHCKEKYEEHLATAPRYIVPFPIPDHWKIGEEVQEGKDFRFQHQRKYQNTEYPYTKIWVDCTESEYPKFVDKRIVSKPIPARSIPADGVSEAMGLVTDAYPNGRYDSEGLVNVPTEVKEPKRGISCSGCGSFTDEHHPNCPWQEDEIQEPEETQEELWKSLLDQYQNDNLTGTDLENVKFMAVISVCIFLKERVTLIRK